MKYVNNGYFQQEDQFETLEVFGYLYLDVIALQQ